MYDEIHTWARRLFLHPYQPYLEPSSLLARFVSILSSSVPATTRGRQRTKPKTVSSKHETQNDRNRHCPENVCDLAGRFVVVFSASPDFGQKSDIILE